MYICIVLYICIKRLNNLCCKNEKKRHCCAVHCRCGCDECVTSSEQDSLRHSQSRINAYRALSSPSLIALSSRDPLLTAFELSWELRRLSKMEQEFRAQYNVFNLLTPLPLFLYPGYSRPFKRS